MSELSFSGHSIIGALSCSEWEVTSSKRLEDTERNIKQPGGKPKPLGDVFSCSAKSIQDGSVGRGACAMVSRGRNLFVSECCVPCTPTHRTGCYGSPLPSFYMDLAHATVAPPPKAAGL